MEAHHILSVRTVTITFLVHIYNVSQTVMILNFTRQVSKGVCTLHVHTLCAIMYAHVTCTL